MERSEILVKLNKVFRDVFEDDSLVITEDTKAEEIEAWDSLMNIALISEIEKVFSLKIAMKDVFNIKSIRKIVVIVSGL